jgi:hypothetical protein
LRPAIPLAVLIVSLLFVGAIEGKAIDLLYISRGLAQGSITDKVLGADPAINPHPVPMPGHYSIGTLGMDAETINRAMRIYMPRSYDSLLEGFDLAVLDEAPCGAPGYEGVYFDAKWMDWFTRAVEAEGFHLSMWGGDASWGGEAGGFYLSWGDTMMEAVLPFQCIPRFTHSAAIRHSIRFLEEGNRLADLPWAGAGFVELMNEVAAKEGTVVVAEAYLPGFSNPWIGYWRYGKGKVTGETQIFGSRGTSNRMMEWDWYQDFLIYLAYFAADKEIPADLYRAHRVREEINTHIAKASMLVSLLEFVERFGANTAGLYRELDVIEEVEGWAEELYVEDDYDGAAAVFEEVHEMWIQVNMEAARLKERSLFWVYIIEWTVTSSALIISGFLIWTLMVRRRLYREARTTRMVRGG